MKFVDLKVGETYAMGSWGTKVTVQGIHQGGKLPEGYKYYHGHSWHGYDNCSKKVVLVTHEDGRKAIVNPQNIKAVWSVYERQKEEERNAREERYKQDQKDREDRIVRWTKLAPVLEVAEIDTYRGIHWGNDRIEVTLEQFETLINQLEGKK